MERKYPCLTNLWGLCTVLCFCFRAKKMMPRIMSLKKVRETSWQNMCLFFFLDEFFLLHFLKYNLKFRYVNTKNTKMVLLNSKYILWLIRNVENSWLAERISFFSPASRYWVGVDCFKKTSNCSIFIDVPPLFNVIPAIVIVIGAVYSILYKNL